MRKTRGSIAFSGNHSTVVQFLLSQFNCTLPPIFHKKRMNSNHWHLDPGIVTILCQSMVNASLCWDNIKGVLQNRTSVFPGSTGYVSPVSCWNHRAFFLSSTIYEIITITWVPIASLSLTTSWLCTRRQCRNVTTK